jgi:hypothetical protein
MIRYAEMTGCMQIPMAKWPLDTMGRAEYLSPPLASLLFVYVENLQMLPILFLVNLTTREASPEQVQRRVMTSY